MLAASYRPVIGRAEDADRAGRRARSSKSGLALSVPEAQTRRVRASGASYTCAASR